MILNRCSRDGTTIRVLLAAMSQLLQQALTLGAACRRFLAPTESPDYESNSLLNPLAPSKLTQTSTGMELRESGTNTVPKFPGTVGRVRDGLLYNVSHVPLTVRNNPTLRVPQFKMLKLASLVPKRAVNFRHYHRLQQQIQRG